MVDYESLANQVGQLVRHVKSKALDCILPNFSATIDLYITSASVRQTNLLLTRLKLVAAGTVSANPNESATVTVNSSSASIVEE
jgi:hypothetical protein